MSKLSNKDIEKIKYYAAFSFMFNVNPLFKARLVEYFDYDIKRAYLASKNDLKKFKEREEDVVISREFLQKDSFDVDECYKKAFSDKDIKILTIEDENYPPLLKEIPDYPISLYYKGDINSIDFQYNLAIVGSRLASNTAKIALANLVSGLKNSNITIVSGLAYGIDAAAHKAALENNLKTIAVVGCGLDIIYPRENTDLFNNIIDGNGVVFSEYPKGTTPMPQNFPQRNRIVTGMSKGTLVAEAKLKSGAMISANLTLEYNRELMCMPGAITNPNTSGIYHLIKQGAGIVTTPEDILEQLNWEFKTSKNQAEVELNKVQESVLKTLELEAKNFDEIINILQLDTAQIMVTLTELEIKGLIKQLNNKYYKC